MLLPSWLQSSVKREQEKTVRVVTLAKVVCQRFVRNFCCISVDGGWDNRGLQQPLEKVTTKKFMNRVRYMLQRVDYLLQCWQSPVARTLRKQLCLVRFVF